MTPSAEFLRLLGSGPVPDRYARPGEKRSEEDMSEAEKLEFWRRLKEELSDDAAGNNR
jgi:hypothetical protein